MSFRHIESSHTKPDPYVYRLARYKENTKKFQSVFGVSLETFSDSLFGFDVVGFDEWLKTPDGTSTADFTKEKFGQEGLDIINSLIELCARPEAVETWTNTKFDISTYDTGGFEKCTYSFMAADRKVLNGEGHYKRGLIAHRKHNYYDEEQDKSGRWNVSTMQGARITKCDLLREAKVKIAQMCQAIDFEKAQTLNLTKEQFDAAMRVERYWREENYV